MARLRIETAPEITVYDESFVIKAASGASAPLAEFKNSAGTVVGNIAVDGTLNILSVVTSNAGTSSTSLATRGYVDSLAAGTNWHQAVTRATNEALSACTYNNGTSGVGATLTGNAFGLLTIDGENPSLGDSVLVKNQANAAHNGIYTVTDIGDVSVAFVLTRRTDADNSPSGEVKPGDAVYVIDGTVSVGNAYVITSTGTGAGGQISIGVDNITYSVFSGTAATQPGAGLTRTGNTINVISADANRIQVNADSIDLATINVASSAGSDTTSFVDSITTDSYGRVTGVRSSSVSFAGYAVLASPALTGIPTSTTAANGTTTTQIATTAFATHAATNAVADAASSASNNFIAKTLVNVKGDLIVATADNTVDRFSIGTDGYFLKANSSTATGVEWGAIPTVSILDDVGDVVITSAVSGQFLKWNGTNWINDNVPIISNIDDITGVTITAAADKDFLMYNGTAWVDQAITLGTDTTGSYVTSLVAGTGVTLTNNSGESATPTVTVDTTVIAALASPTFTGTPTLPTGTIAITQTAADNSTAVATTAFVTTADNLKANLASPALTGTPTAPTAAAATDTTQIATTAFVRAEVAALVNSAPGTLDTLGELAASLANNASLSTTLTDSIALKAPLASPTFTGVVTLPAGTISNADVSSTAAIEQNKIADTLINAQAASYTLVLADKNKLVEMGVGSGNTLTVPPNSSVAFPVGSTITILQTGAGQCTLTAGAGVTVNGTPGLKLRTTWASATIIKRATDTWVALGDLVA